MFSILKMNMNTNIIVYIWLLNKTFIFSIDVAHTCNYRNVMQIVIHASCNIPVTDADNVSSGTPSVFTENSITLSTETRSSLDQSTFMLEISKI